MSDFYFFRHVCNEGENNMSYENYNDKDLLSKILHSEFEREEKIKKLSAELDELESREIRDAKRIGEIVEELKIINPFPEDDTGESTAKVITGTKRKRRFIPLKISAVCIVFVLSVQFISVAAGLNFFDWSKNTFMFLLGIEIQQNNIALTASWSRQYETIKEFEAAENIKILVPAWLPKNLEINFLTFSYNQSTEENRISILYNDETTFLIIKLNMNIPNTEDAEIYEYNNILFYVLKNSNVILWEYDGNFYNLSLGFDIGEYAEKIIENIK